ncbi:MAG: hypothetical protein ACYSTT_12245 [Planctomycetota bacterium]|jgi:hypothetical protein
MKKLFESPLNNHIKGKTMRMYISLLRPFIPIIIGCKARFLSTWQAGENIRIVMLYFLF